MAKYSKELKEKALEMLKSSTVEQVSNELSITKVTLYKWKNDGVSDGNKKRAISSNEAIEKIKNEIADLEDKLSKKKEELKQAEASKLEEENKKIIEAFNKSGKSFDEIMKILSENPESIEENPEK